jgi:hypothetical protein
MLAAPALLQVREEDEGDGWRARAKRAHIDPQPRLLFMRLGA